MQTGQGNGSQKIGLQEKRGGFGVGFKSHLPKYTY
jgi:hypothetical protein